MTQNERTQGIEYLEASAAEHLRAAEAGAADLERLERANRQREEAIQSPGGQAMHTANRQGAVYLENQVDADRGLAKMMQAQAQILREVDKRHSAIDEDAHRQITPEATSAQIAEIVATAHAAALAASANGLQAFEARHMQWAKDHAETYKTSAALLGANPAPIQPTPNPDTGTITALGNDKTRSKGDRSEGGSSPTPGSSEPNSQASTGQTPGTGGAGGNGQRSQGEQKLRQDLSTGEPGESGAPAAGTPALPFSPLSGGGMPGSGGGLGGGGLGGGGLGSGLGSGGPLSSLMGGVGSNPAASGLASGVPGANPVSNAAGSSALGNPAGLFAQGLSSGASSVSPVSSASPATAAPSSVGGGSAGGVAAPAAGGGGPAAPAAAGASGLHATPAAAGAGPSASASAMPAMSPSTGMGAAASGAGGAGPAVSAMGSSTSAASAATGAASGGAGGAPVGNAGPTLVPAAVVSPADTGQRGKVLSRDARAAATLAWLLQHQCHRVFPLDWAVGVFRSNAGSETVVVSAEGSSYVPAGVFVPRGVQLLVADPLVDKGFRDRWFGCADPAQVLVDYARLRRESGWELAAAATNGPVDQLRGAGVEYADSCTFDRSPLRESTSVPVLDAMHVHRLQLEFPDLYERLVRLSGAEDRFGRELMMTLARGLVDEVSGFQHPLELPQTWSALVAGQQPSTQAWQHYATVTSNEFMFTTPKRPPACPVEVYRQSWMVCRAMEVVGGFAGRPLPLADMVYALAAAWPGLDMRWQLEPPLRAAEVELGW